MSDRPATAGDGDRADRPANPLIELRGLTRHYPMGQHVVAALRGIDLTIDAGQFVAIVGASGSGKSTLMYLLGCLDRPTSGSYRLAGHEVSQLDDRGLSRVRNRQVGFVFQQFFLLPELDVLENAALGLTYAGERREQRRATASALAERMGLADRLHHRPAQLSGGQMQRVAIARALAGRPRLVLADEPTGNLDSRTSAEIITLLGDLHAAGATVLLVTHDAELAGRAERVITLSDGRVVEDRLNTAPGRPAPTVTRAPAAPADGGLRWADLLKMAVREGLLAHKLRSGLTMLGIIFGIAAVIAMTAITEGGKRRQLEQLRQIGMNNIQVQALELQAARRVRERRVNPRGLNPQDLEALRRHVPGIASATAWKKMIAEVRHGATVVEEVSTLGVLGAFPSVANYHVARGRFVDDVDARRFRRVCAVGPRIAADLGLGHEPLGKALVIGDQPFVVVGLMEHKAFTESAIADISVANRNREVYVPFAVMQMFFQKDSRDGELDAISLRMASDEGLVRQSELIRHIVGDLHRDAEDFGVFVPLEKLKQAQETKHVFNVIIVVIAGIALIVGGIGIMNIMLATVTERTREIGIRRALGATRGDTLRQFLTEAVLLACFGGILGIAAGVLGGLLVQQVFGFPVAFRPGIAAVAVIVSMAVGVTFGLYPAWIAAHMEPVEALRN